MTETRTMNAKEYLACLETLGITNIGAAHFFGVAPRTTRRWIEQDHVDRAVAMVLRMMIEKDISPLEMLTVAKVRQPYIKYIMRVLYDRRATASAS